MKYTKGIILLLLFCAISLANFAIYAERQKKGALPAKEIGLSLEECIKFAVENSFEVKLAEIEFLITQTDQTAAEAIYDTLLSIEIAYEKDKRQPLSVFGADDKQTNTYSLQATKELSSGTKLTLSLEDTREWSNSAYTSRNPAHTAEAALEVRQPLGKNRFGFIDKREISITHLTIQNADLDTKERIELLLANVEKAYWEWAFSKENLQIHRRLLEKAQKLHQSNSKIYDLGRIERGDFLASQANLLIRERDLRLAANKYRRAEEKIKLLMNIEAAEQLYPLERLQYRKLNVNLVDCLQRAFRTRRDYRQAKRELQIENITLETKENARWPEIDLVASLAANGIDSQFGRAANNIATDGNVDYYIGLEVSIPIENNLAKSQLEKAMYNKEKALLSLKSKERAIVTEIGDAFGDYITYKDNLNKITEAAGLQQEKLGEEEKRFKYGRSNTKRLIDYQQDYLNAQLEVAKSLIDLALVRVNLEKALNIILARYEELL